MRSRSRRACALILGGISLCTGCHDGRSSVDGGAPPTDAAVDAASPPSDLAVGGNDLRRVATACDVVTGTGCSDPAAPKCTIVAVRAGQVAACLAAGTKLDGDPCTRTSQGIGFDDCAAGLSCAFLGARSPDAGGTRTCHRYCYRDADCAPGEGCAGFFPEIGAGICGSTCAPFGSGCTDRMVCHVWLAIPDGSAFHAYCGLPATVGIGGACGLGNEDCSSKLACVLPAVFHATTCQTMCDDNHACASGTCFAIRGLPDGAGFCTP